MSATFLSAVAVVSPAATQHISRRVPSSIGVLRINQRRGVGGGGGVLLRSSRWVIEAIGQKEVREEEQSGPTPLRCCSFGSHHPHHEDVAVAERGGGGVDRTVEVMVAVVATVVLGVGNRVLYKLALVPLKHYPFFLAQLATFGLSRLHLEWQLESFLVWQLVFSYIFLGRRYSFKQLFGCFLVAVGVIVTVASGSGTGSLMEAGIFWSIMMIVSFLLQAADTVLKEAIFLDAAQRLKGGTVDLFVVNSFGSAFQAVFICLLLPFFSNLWGIPFNQLPSYLKDGAACFFNVGTMSSRCEGAPLLPLLFIIVNMGFNISLLHLLKISSAVVSCLASTFSVPISVYLFTLPLPYLGVASSLPPGFVAGAIILAVGLLIYTWTPSLNLSSKPLSLVNPRIK